VDAGTIIAIYAGVVATASLLWQVYSWWHRRRHRVEVTASMALIGHAGVRATQVIAVTATNRSEHPVRVAGAGLEAQDGSGFLLHVVQQPEGTRATIPGIVQPNDSGQTYLERPVVEENGISVVEPVVAWVRLATGEQLRSKPRPLLRRD
jgi:hypothetical protein